MGAWSEFTVPMSMREVEPADEEERPPMADLCNGRPSWITAGEVHGEGIFIRFNEKAISDWEKLETLKRRDQKIEQGHRG